jgi:ATP-binding cassette subfamily C protein EexD
VEKEVKSDLQKAITLCQTSFASAGFFSLFINFLMLVPAIYMLQLYDRVITSGSESTLVMLTLIMVLLLLTLGALEWVRTMILIRTSARLEALLNVRLFGVTFKSALVGNGMGSQPLDDLSGLRQFLTGNGLFAFFDAPWLPIYIAVMFMFHEWFGWMAVGTSIILIILAYTNERLTAETLKYANSAAMAGRGLVNKNLRNAEVVESMGMLAAIRGIWLEGVNRVLFLQAKASVRAGTITALSKTIRIMSQSLILGLGAYLVLAQEITPGLMIAGSILLGRALAPIDLMIGSWKGFISARGQYERLNDLLLRVPEELPKMALPSPDGELIVDNLVITAPGGRSPIVKGVNFSLAPGESLGIIGPSAAGKSTLARALLGIWPALQGKVRLDGVDIFSWNREELGPFIGYLPQDIELFEGTISQNISRFGEVEPAKVVAAAKLSDVHEMILALPDGYDTVIGASGGVLSGGQRQRIGLARAVYDEPKMVLLDEPNSNLDEQGEVALAGALEALRKINTTVIIITHRPGVLGIVDKLLLMNDGQMLDYGLREEVLKRANQKIAKQKAKTVGPAPTTVTPNF